VSADVRGLGGRIATDGGSRHGSLDLARLGRLASGSAAGAIGVVVSAGLAFVYLGVVGRALGPAVSAPVLALWSAVFLLQAVALVPAEQEIARALGARTRPVAEVTRAGVGVAAIVGVVTTCVAAAVAVIGFVPLFGGSLPVALALPAAIAGFASAVGLKAHAAGTGRFARWAAFLVVDSGVRLGLALLLVVSGTNDPGPYAIALVAGCWSATILLGRPLLEETRRTRRLAGLRPLLRGTAWLAVVNTGASILANGGVLIAGFLATAVDIADVGRLGMALMLARLPLFAFQAVTAALLPGLASRSTTRGVRSLMRELAGTGVALGGLGLVVVLAAAFLGPAILGALFGPAYRLDGVPLALLAASSVAWLLAALLTQGVVAAGRHRAAAAVWLSGCLAAAVAAAVLAGVDLVDRVPAVLLAGSATAAIGAVVAIAATAARAGTARHAGSVPADDARRPLRVGYVYDALYPATNGGAERRFAELSRRLAATHTIEYLTWTFWPGPARRTVGGVTQVGVGAAPDFYGRDGKRRIREALAFTIRLVPVLLRRELDVLDVSATPTLPLYGAALAARLTGTPMVVTWHEYWDDHWHAYLPAAPVTARVARMLERNSRRFGDHVVAVSAFTAARMGEGRWSHRLEVVPNGVCAELIEAATPDADRVEVLYVGRLIDEKRVDLLVRAIALLSDTGCRIIGDGPELGRLTALAASLGLAGRVRFAGRLERDEDVHAALRATRILVLPSAREGYGIVVVEAQAAGAIPIVTRGTVTAAPALVRDGIDGLVVDPSPEALADAIRLLLSDPARCARMRAAARAVGRATSWDRTAAAMAAIYRAAAAGETVP